MMVKSNNPSSRLVLLLVVAASIVCFSFVGIFRNLAEGTRDPTYTDSVNYMKTQELTNIIALNSNAFAGGPAIAPKLGNETVKAELGRAAWKLFHTTFARFPDEPTQEESAMLLAYVHLFQRLYPCGECATHFGEILYQYPPQVSSRSAAAAWGCHVHNEVNKSLMKPIFDCSQIGDFYDCGCAEDADGEESQDTSAPKHNS